MVNKQIKRVKGFSDNGVPVEGLTGFETDYKSIKIVDKVVKTGDGDQDFVIVKDVIEEKTPIQEVIDADKESVGVYNIIKQVIRTGDTSLLPVDTGECNVDFVGAPEDLMEVKQLGIDAEKKFASLPKELTKNLDMKNFINNLSQEQFDAFVKAVADRSSGKKEDD